MLKRENFYKQSISEAEMLQELILNFAIPKRDICRVLKISLTRLNFFLRTRGQHPKLSQKQKSEVIRFYQACIQYPPEEFLVSSYLQSRKEQ